MCPYRSFFDPEKARCVRSCSEKYSYENSDYLVNFMGAYKFKEMFLKTVYAEGALYEFEGLQLNGPKDYDFVCTQLYGDYMTPPPDAEKTSILLKLFGRNKG